MDDFYKIDKSVIEKYKLVLDREEYDKKPFKKIIKDIEKISSETGIDVKLLLWLCNKNEIINYFDECDISIYVRKCDIPDINNFMDHTLENYCCDETFYRITSQMMASFEKFAMENPKGKNELEYIIQKMGIEVDLAYYIDMHSEELGDYFYYPSTKYFLKKIIKGIEHTEEKDMQYVEPIYVKKIDVENFSVVQKFVSCVRILKDFMKK